MKYQGIGAGEMWLEREQTSLPKPTPGRAPLTTLWKAEPWRDHRAPSEGGRECPVSCDQTLTQPCRAQGHAGSVIPMCVCVCVCVRDRERECAVCVCERERQREREIELKKLYSSGQACGTSLWDTSE